MCLNKNKLTKRKSKKILELISKWVSGLFDEDDVPEKLFSMLIKYKNNFPKECLFNGTVYRKTNNINLESDPKNNIIYRMRSCSINKGDNHKNLYNHFVGKYYQFTCEDGFILEKISKYLCDLLKKNYDEIPYYGIFGYSPIERMIEESEVICVVSKKDLKREKL